MIILLWSGVFITLLVFYFSKLYSKLNFFDVKHLPIVPLFGNMLNIILRKRHIVIEIDKLYKRFPHERFVGMYKFFKPIIILQDIELIKKITIDDFDHFHDRASFVNVAVEPLLARSLLAMKEKEWKDMRATLSPAFTSSNTMPMVPFMEEVSEQVTRLLKKKIEESDSNAIDVEVKELTMRFANDVIASCVFGIKVDSHNDEKNKFYEIGKQVVASNFQEMSIFTFLSTFPAISNMLKLKVYTDSINKFFIDLVTNMMKHREARQAIRHDMIHLLMEAKKGRLSHKDENDSEVHPNAGFATVEESSYGKKSVKKELIDNDLVSQAVSFFTAGFATVSTAISFALYELAINPEIQNRLAREIKEHDTQNDGKVNFNTIQKMTYLDMVTSEVLRLWPPVLFLDRVCVNDYILGRTSATSFYYELKKGDVVLIPVWSIHRDPTIFPNPEIFKPERYSEENKQHINPFTYMPFGIGPRNCIGSRFALCEIKMFLYQILLHMEVSASEKTCIPAKLSTESFNPQMEGGHWLKFRMRS